MCFSMAPYYWYIAGHAIASLSPWCHSIYKMWCRATANGEEFEDTRKRGKPIVFIFGGRPFTGGLCLGVEEALKTMRGGDLSALLLLIAHVLSFLLRTSWYMRNSTW